jgi:probable F420-dependent oxidoreductase
VDSKEAFAQSALLLGATERAVVGTGIANIWARDPVAMANGWRALSDAHPGRFLLGIGVSHRYAVDRRGHRYERPYSRMREYLDAMDAAPTSAPQPAGPLWRVLAALGPRMLELAAERAEGAHPYFVPVEHTAFARARLGPDPVLAVEQTAVLQTDPSRARGIARTFADGYLASPNYARNLKRMGWGDHDIAGGGSDRLIDAVVAWGDVDRIVARVREHLEAGADHVCLQVVAEAEDDVCLGQLEELAPALSEL